VCVNYYADEQKADAEQVAAAVDEAGGRGMVAQADVSDETAVRGLVATAIDSLDGLDGLDGLDVLVNNAGIEKQIPLLNMELAEWNKVIATNLSGAFLCLREAGKHMVAAGGGVVVNISSVHEFIPWPGYAHYCASKGGMKLLMQTAARELAGHRIRVINIAPGGDRHPAQPGGARRSGGVARGGIRDPVDPDGPAGGDRRRGGLGGQ
jgi:glucose 1-dehydrogenase